MNNNHKLILLILCWIIVFTLICIGSIIISGFMFEQTRTIDIVQKHHIIDNNSIVYLIETSDERFYTISQTDYNRLNLGFCEVRIVNKNIVVFNHLHTKCNYTYN